jgi:hypothetical protein
MKPITVGGYIIIVFGTNLCVNYFEKKYFEYIAKNKEKQPQLPEYTEHARRRAAAAQK